VLNLHLLRVDGMLVLYCAPLVAAATVTLVRQDHPVKLATAVIACLGLFVGLWPIVSAAMLFAHCLRIWPNLNRLPEGLGAWQARPGLCRRALLAGSLILAAGSSLFVWNLHHVQPTGTPSNKDLEGTNAPVQDWLDVERWARNATPINAMFLVPPVLGSFRTESQRQIWVASQSRSGKLLNRRNRM
jgi:hypothetical protein